MASSHASVSLPIRTHVASIGPEPLAITLKAITSYDQVLASWSKAIDLFNSNLTKDESKKIELAQFPRADFVDFLNAANSIKEQVEQKRYSWTGNVQNVFRHINRYALIGDIIVQHHAEYTSLVWGAFRFLLLFAVEERNSSEELSRALATIIQIVFRAEEYAKLFSTPSSSSTDRVFQSLHENLVRLFAEILSFLIRTTRFFEKPTLSRFVSAGISPFNTKFNPILKRIEDYERDVEKDKSLLESEARKTQQQYDNGVWLKHADFETDLQKLQQTHISGTCQWFLQSPLYLKWRDSSPSCTASNFMWIQGKPGSGKSVLASQIIRDLHSFGASIVIYIFCKSGEEDKNTLESILRNLIFEMLEWSPQKQAFHRLLLNARLREKSQHAQSIAVLWNLLAQMISVVDVIHCVIDGLDECHSSKSERVSFLSRLAGIFKQSPCAKLVLISQLHRSESVDHLSLWMDFSIQPSSVRDDIELLALTRIEKSEVLSIHPDKENLLKQLVARSNGMILWAELMIKELEAGHWNIQNVLQKPPEGLFEMWRSILRRISHSRLSTEKISHTLQLVLVAARPLSHEELALGLAVAQGLCQHEDYDTRGDAMAEGRLAVLELSPLLTSLPDNTVQLTHSSLKDYLFCQDALSVSKIFDFNEQDAHARMATVLIIYLSFQSFQSALTKKSQPKHFLLDYATRWLVYHSTRTGVSTSTADRMVKFFDTVQGWKWLQRLSDACGMSFGYLQLVQSDMASWAQSSRFSDKTVYILSNFLLILAKNRHETMNSLDEFLLLDNMAYLVWTYCELGHLSEAEELETQALAISSEKLGANHPHTLSSMENLVHIIRKQGRGKEAEKMQTKIVEIQNRVLGVEHSNTLTSMNELALTISYQGRRKEAEKMQEQVVETQTRVLGPEHPDTVKSIEDLAWILGSQGRYKESEKLNIQVLEILTRVLGAEHPDTLVSMDSLAFSFQSQGRYKESEELNMQSRETRTRLLGAEHPDTLISMESLASNLDSQGRHKESEKLIKQILEMRTRVLGAEHPDTMWSMEKLARTFNSQSRYKESEWLNIQILKTRTSVLGAEHPDTLNSLAYLARIFNGQGRYKESEKLNIQILERRTRALGAEHPETLVSMDSLASTLDSQGRYEESERLNIQTLETRTRVLGAEHPDTLVSMENLACTFNSQGRYKESEELNIQILETRTKVLGAEHPDILASMENLAWTFNSQGRYKESEKLNIQILETRTRVLGAEHPDTLVSMHNLASTYVGQDRHNEAIEMIKEVIALRTKTIGPEHPDTLEAVSFLNEFSST